jgi:hypothetical protein
LLRSLMTSCIVCSILEESVFMFKPFQELKEKHLIHPLMFIFGGVLEISNHLRGLMLSGMLLTWLILQKVSFEQSSNKPCVATLQKEICLRKTTDPCYMQWMDRWWRPSSLWLNTQRPILSIWVKTHRSLERMKTDR